MSFLKGTEPAQIAASLREIADAIAAGEYFATSVMINTEQDRHSIEIIIEGYHRRQDAATDAQDPVS